MDNHASQTPTTVTAAFHPKVGVVLVHGVQLGSREEPPSDERACHLVSSTIISVSSGAGSDKHHQRRRFEVDHGAEVFLRSDTDAVASSQSSSSGATRKERATAAPAAVGGDVISTACWSGAADAMRQNILDGIPASLCDGFSATLVSCGASKTGKTTILFGCAGGDVPRHEEGGIGAADAGRGNSQSGGVVQGILSDLVDSMQRLPAYVEQSITVTAVEISTSAAPGQSEKVRDLLDPRFGAAFQDRKLRMYPETGLCVEGAALGQLATHDDLTNFLRCVTVSRGNGSNNAASLAMGRLFPVSVMSGGAHVLLQVHLRRKDVHQGVMRRATLTVVDFSGPCPAVVSSSSTASSTTGITSPTTSQAPNGAKELTRSVPVSKALSSLHRIVELLLTSTTTTTGSIQRPPESTLRRMARESLVTSLLGDVLVGDGRLYVVSTVSTSKHQVEHSLRTLGFVAQLRALKLQSKPREERCDVVVHAIQQEMAHMKSKLLNESSSTKTRHEDLARIQDQLRCKAEILVDEHNRKSQVREDLSKQVDHLTRELDVMQSLVASKQLAAAEASRMKHELERITSARASAMQRLQREESLKQQAAERLAEARRLEKEIEQMKEQRLVMEAAARREQVAEAQRVMRTVFTTATSIGRDRHEMKRLDRRNAALKEAIASLTARVAGLDELIAAVDGHVDDLDTSTHRLEEQMVALARAKSAVLQAASDTERVLEEECERLMFMTQVSGSNCVDEHQHEDGTSDEGRSETHVVRASAPMSRSLAAVDEALIRVRQERVHVLDAQLADTQRERLALEAASLRLQQDLLVRQEEFLRLGGNDGLRHREVLRLDTACDEVQQCISSLEREIVMLERVHKMYDRMEGRCEDSGNTRAQQQQDLLQKQHEQHQAMLRRGLGAVVEAPACDLVNAASPGRLSRSFQQQRDAMMQSPSLRRFV